MLPMTHTHTHTHTQTDVIDMIQHTHILGGMEAETHTCSNAHTVRWFHVFIDIYLIIFIVPGEHAFISL